MNTHPYFPSVVHTHLLPICCTHTPTFRPLYTHTYFPSVVHTPLLPIRCTHTPIPIRCTHTPTFHPCTHSPTFHPLYTHPYFPSVVHVLLHACYLLEIQLSCILLGMLSSDDDEKLYIKNLWEKGRKYYSDKS